MDLFAIFAFALFVDISHSMIIPPASRQARLSLAEPMPYYFNNEIDGHPGTYSYGYDVADPATGNTQFRTEERFPNGTVVGSYGYVDAWGKPYRYKYIADEKGYRVMQDRPHRPAFYPSYPATVNPSRPSIYPAESSITWTRPKAPKNKKKGNYYVNRPTHNFVGPPSSYAED